LPAVEISPPAARFALEGLTLQAPEGLVLERALIVDGGDAGDKSAFAIARPPDAGALGEVIFFRGPGPDGALPIATVLATPLPPAADAGCAALGRLAEVGKHSVLAEIGAVCSAPAGAAPAQPGRYISVIDAGLVAKVRFAITVADPYGSPALAVDAMMHDRDGDGRDDLAVRLTVSGGGQPLEPGPSVSVISAWLDRPAGLSRDTGTIEASFASLAEWAAMHAGRAKEAPEVPGYVAQARALWRAVCAENGSPRVVAVAGAGSIRCSVPRALENLGLAEVRAFASMGDPLRAALALGRAERPPASITPSRVADAVKWIAQQAPIATARMIRRAAAVPMVPPTHEPAWGPLAFEPSGKLLVRTRAGVVRFDPDLGDEAAAGVADWKPNVTSPDGSTTWIAAYDDCTGLPLRATFETAGDQRRDVLLPVAPPLGNRCGGAKSTLVAALPMAWGRSGLEAIVDGEAVLIAPDLGGASLLTSFIGQPPVPGAPRSPSGRAYVIACQAGLLVQNESGARLLRASELDGAYTEEHDCVVSDDTTHVACVRAGGVWAGTWDAPEGP
jgi:hypothetical protein